MDKSNNYFIISGFISLSLFVFFAVMFFYMLFSSKNVKTFALKKDNYISISIDMSVPKMKPSKKNIQKATSKIVDKTLPDTPKNVNIEELFSKVWTRKITTNAKPKEIKINPRRIDEIQKKSKILTKNKVESISKIVKNEIHKESTSNEVNEYLAKIQALVYEHFFPPQNSYGYSVKAVIELNAIGKMTDFRILNYSVNKSLNDECDKVKNRLLNVVFPKNPQHVSGTYTIILTAKE